MITTNPNNILFSFETTGEQREIWNSCQFGEEASLAYNESITISFEGDLSIDSLKEGIEQVGKRHLILNSSLSENGKILRIYNHSKAKLVCEEYESIEDIPREEELACLTSFDLTNGPLIRFKLLSSKNKSQPSFLIITAHHLICDGWSWAILTSDLVHFYNGHKNRKFTSLPKACQYWTFSQEREKKNEDLVFWQKQFASLPNSIDYNKKVRPHFRTFNSLRVDTEINPDIIKKLRDRAREKKVTLYHYLLTAFFFTIGRRVDEQDLTIGISHAGQTEEKYSSLFGHCVGLLPIRIKDFNNHNFDSNLTKVKEAVFEAQRHNTVSFGEICEISNVPRDPSRIPLVPITFNLDVQPSDQGLRFDGVKAKYKTNPRFFENFEMFINFTLIGDEGIIENQFNTDLFDTDEIIDLQETYLKFLIALSLDEHVNEINYLNFFPEGRVGHTVHSVKSNGLIKEKTIELQEPSVSSSQSIPDELNLKLKLIWEKVLGVDGVSDRDGFFALGGHSLLVTEVILAIKNEIGVKISMKDLFLNQEFGEFKRVVFNYVSNNSPNEIGLPDIKKQNWETDTFPLSWQQQRTWLFQELNKNSSLFNLPSLFQFKGNLNPHHLAEALKIFKEKNLLLNYVVSKENGLPKWTPNSRSDFSVECIDLNLKYPKSSYKEITQTLVKQYSDEAKVPFNLNNDDLFYAKIFSFRENGTEYTFLFLKVHHILWDGWCYDIFLDQLDTIYNSVATGKLVENDGPNSVNYFDYTQWQSNLPENGHYQSCLNFWDKTLADLPDPLELPIKPNFHRVEKKFNGKSYFFNWSEDEVSLMEKISKEKGTTLFNFLLTCFNIFLYRYSGEKDIVVGTPVRGRDTKELENIIGFFVNNIAIRNQVAPSLNFGDNLDIVIRNSSEAFENSIVPFDEVVRRVMPKRDKARTPIYQAFIMYQDATNREDLFAGAERSSFRLPRGACHTDIDLWARRDNSGMIGGFDFDSEIFNEEQMEQMVENFCHLVREIVQKENLNKLLKNLSFPKSDEIDFLVNDLNKTKVAINAVSLADHIDFMASLNAEKIAITSKNGCLTYREIKNYSDAIARNLRKRGVRQGDLVGMALPRDFYLPACLLGILKAGAGYVPIDPNYPEDRIRYMIENSDLALIICDSGDKNKEVFKICDTIALDAPSVHQDFWKCNSNEVLPSINNDDTAYVIYTSGSTGLPKGVTIPHQAMLNFVQSMAKVPGLSKEDKLIAVTTLSFDIAVLEIFTPLYCGAELYLCDKEESMFGDSLLEVIAENKATVLQATPATWRQLTASGLADYVKNSGRPFKGLCGGEPLPVDLKDKILASITELWNMYGPTETTVWSTCHKVSKSDHWISIGRPIDNTQIYILSDELEICPYGSIGEICIGGQGLAKGYLNREDLTKDRFTRCDSLNGQVIYRTGDLGRYKEDGLIECLGRNDGQVKVRGFRIELGEIEAVLSKSQHISSQVVIVREDRPGDARINAYIIKEKDSTLSENEVIKDLKNIISDNLPFYMMPSHFNFLEEFPLTLNGKIDKKKLPAPHFGQSEKTEGNDGINSDSQIVTKGSEVDSLEKTFQKIWCSTLNSSDAKHGDDFFEVGGHSLLSVTLFSKIEEELGVTLPLSVLFEASTFGALLEILEGKLSKAIAPQKDLAFGKSPFVIPMRVNGRKKAIIFFHGVGGNILNYKGMLPFVPNDFDAYGVQAPGVGGEASLATSVIEMAMLYANDLLFLESYENVIFCGGSMGGLLAFETAGEFEDLGGEVDEIIMFDTFGPRDLFEGIISTNKQSFKERFSNYIQYRTKELYARLITKLSRFRGLPIPHKVRHFLVELNNYKLLSHHKYSTLDKNIHLIRSPLEKEGHYSVAGLGWSKVALKGFNEYIVEGTGHDDFMESPRVGKELRKLLTLF